ncbi:MAG: carboxymuconolactone decarboxylase family protein [Hamadaea sp.]|uniref:carboxymuconolactone decarboxylase family protein n=1 Tax=Hamadaea sp. TaxID=2024425 RepID=UPI001819E0D7|nr:carboxymuconolactone decarboxylase family protein [Hamadaea sp.]NUR71535.1 carboxymuconolactone decarboxylase family protein [Hamadaea sp.]NUT19665.1 carboxymuconolactone decarboxylase family protein [Hamadaea sp.]
MPRLAQVTDDPTGLLDRVRQQLGKVPNLYATMANGPAALDGYLALRGHLVKGKLTARLREQLALLVAQENGCDYCVAAHTFRGKLMKLTDEELLATRVAEDANPHAEAVLRLARDVMRTRGKVDDGTLAEVRAAGVTDAEIAEVVAHVALNVMSNYFNHLAQPELDFPAAPELGSPAANAEELDSRGGKAEGA